MNRDSIDKKYQWDLSKIYSNLDDFNKDVAFVSSKLIEFSKYKDVKYDEDNLYEVINLCMCVSRVL